MNLNLPDKYVSLAGTCLLLLQPKSIKQCVTVVLNGMRGADLIGHDWNQLWHTFWLSFPSTLPLAQAELQVHLHYCSPNYQKRSPHPLVFPAPRTWTCTCAQIHRNRAPYVIHKGVRGKMDGVMWPMWPMLRRTMTCRHWDGPLTHTHTHTPAVTEMSNPERQSLSAPLTESFLLRGPLTIIF